MIFRVHFNRCHFSIRPYGTRDVFVIVPIDKSVGYFHVVPSGRNVVSDGTNKRSIEHISNVVFNLVRIEERNKLGPKIYLLVMLGLIVDVIDGAGLFADRYRKRAITFLPLE